MGVNQQPDVWVDNVKQPKNIGNLYNSSLKGLWVMLPRGLHNIKISLAGSAGGATPTGGITVLERQK